MNNFKKCIVLIAVLIFSGFSAQIEVIIENIKTDNGTLYIALYKAGPDFPDKEKRLDGGPVEIKDKKASIKFNNLLAGSYAISTHHDLNSNRKVDKNFLGMPKEPYGFSNNLYGPFGKPDYKKATISVRDDDSISIKIKLR